MSEEEIRDTTWEEPEEEEQVLEIVEKLSQAFTADGKTTASIETYLRIKALFRKKALRLLKGPKLSCFLCVALHANAEKESWPSIDLIERETGYSRAAVCRALKELETLGFIERKRRKHESTLYTVKGYIWYGRGTNDLLLDEGKPKVSKYTR